MVTALQKECDERFDKIKFSDDPLLDFILRDAAKAMWMEKETKALCGIMQGI
jgi:hypothetical protein